MIRICCYIAILNKFAFDIVKSKHNRTQKLSFRSIIYATEIKG